MINFIMKQPGATEEWLGLIPMFLDPRDKRPAAAQIEENYRHGGGWSPIPGFSFLHDGRLQYGDPNEEDADEPLTLIAEAKLGDETIKFFDCSWLAIIQPNGSFEVSRID